MKLFIASDIHGSAYYCHLMLERYKAENADRLLLLGDILYHGPRNDLPKEYAPKQVIDPQVGIARPRYLPDPVERHPVWRTRLDGIVQGILFRSKRHRIRTRRLPVDRVYGKVLPIVRLRRICGESHRGDKQDHQTILFPDHVICSFIPMKNGTSMSL